MKLQTFFGSNVHAAIFSCILELVFSFGVIYFVLQEKQAINRHVM